MSHAIDFFYQHAGHVLRPYMTTTAAHPDDFCAVCHRPASQWHITDEKVIFNNYGNIENHCLACHSLYEGSVELFGVERLAKGTPVPMKLGMATGCGVLVTPTKTTLFLNGFIKKMGQADKPPFEMIELSGNAAHKAMIANPPTEPEYLYIGNFGRKKAELVSNMALSSPDTLVICEEATQTIVPMAVTRDLIDVSRDLGLKTSEVNGIKRLLRQLYTGAISPDDDKLHSELSKWASQWPRLFDTLKTMPADPHQRLNILQLW
ncbi:MAG: hypothetical protein AWU57_218 [Marinobacter sp. T13-3]|nr:MAG: hypothetical protein AWU57_218 [Marinobacter sp. T13-3]